MRYLFERTQLYQQQPLFPDSRLHQLGGFLNRAASYALMTK